jgi:hypothetical protein
MAKRGTFSRGSAIILTILVVLALFVLVCSVVTISNLNLYLVDYYRCLLHAQNAARAGIAHAMYYIDPNITWTAGFSNQPMPNNLGSYTITFDRNTSIPFSTNNAQGDVPTPGYDIQVPSHCYHLISIGRYRKAISRKQVFILVGWRIFRNALFGNTGISLRGNAMVDSYDSRLGTYAATHEQVNGSLRTNSVAASAVSLQGSVSVYGDVVVGPGGDPDTVIRTQGAAFYSGEARVAPEAVPIEDRTPPSGTNLGDRRYTGGTITLEPGVYNNLTLSGKVNVNLRRGANYVFNSITMSGNSCLNQIPGTGVTNIFVRSSMDFTGSSFNTGGTPPDFRVYGTSTFTSMRNRGNSQFYGAFYLPRANLDIAGTADIYGSVFCNSVGGTGTANVHWDRALYDITITADLRAWKMQVLSDW